MPLLLPQLSLRMIWRGVFRRGIHLVVAGLKLAASLIKAAAT